MKKIITGIIIIAKSDFAKVYGVVAESNIINLSPCDYIEIENWEYDLFVTLFDMGIISKQDLDEVMNVDIIKIITE